MHTLLSLVCLIFLLAACPLIQPPLSRPGGNPSASNPAVPLVHRQLREKDSAEDSNASFPSSPASSEPSDAKNEEDENPCAEAFALTLSFGQAPQASKISIDSMQKPSKSGAESAKAIYPAMQKQAWTSTNDIKLVENLNRNEKISMQANTLGFYVKEKAYYELTNFWQTPICVGRDPKPWPGVEWYFQAQKFPNYPDLQNQIRLAQRPRQVFNLGRKNSKKIRADWDQVKQDIMLEALWAKFTQHNELKTVLLKPGKRILVESSPIDSLWGYGANKQGLNHLGQMLMHIREILAGRKAAGSEYVWKTPKDLIKKR